MTELLPIAPAAAEAATFMAFATDAHSRKALAMAAAAHGWRVPDIRDGGLEAAQEHIAASAPPQILIVDISGSQAPLGAIDALADVCAPDTRVMAIGNRNDVALFRGLLALGVADYLLKPLDPAVLNEALDRMLKDHAPVQQVAAPVRKAVSMAFIGARGGAGVTSLALATATLLAEDPARRVLLFDFDLQAGTAALDLDAELSPGLADLLQFPDRVDQAVVDAAMKTHKLGFRMLAAEEPIDRLIGVKPDAVQALMAAVASDCDAIIIDMPRRLDRAARAILRTVDRVVIVTPLTLGGLRETQRLAAFLTGLRAGQRPIVVANRVGESAAEVSVGDFEKGIAARISAQLPYQPRISARATEGATSLATVAGRTRLGSALRTLACELGASETPAPPTSALARLWNAMLHRQAS